MNSSIRIGTRSSALALAQATEVKVALEKAHPGLGCVLVTLKTSGDDFTAWKKDARPEGGVPLKGLFVKEIEEALLNGTIELAVHSVKDLQAELPPGLKLAAVPKRQDPRDALILREKGTVKSLAAGTKVGVSSLRRQSQLKRLRRDLELVSIRGNVDTRLGKLDKKECDALLLAACGLIRLGLSDRISEYLDPIHMIPAAGQGALGIEIRSDREDLLQLVQGVDDPNSHCEIEAERAFLKALGGGCSVPIGALARVSDTSLTLTGVVLSPDGLKVVRKEIVGSKQAAEKLGTELASHLRAAGADRLLYGQWAAKR